MGSAESTSDHDTTVCGILCKDGIVLGADTWATMEGKVVKDNQAKILDLHPNIFGCGAGAFANITQARSKITKLLDQEVESTQQLARVDIACKLIQDSISSGAIAVSAIVGGADQTGPHLYFINAQGTTPVKNYAVAGTGGKDAQTVLENNWQPDIKKDAAMVLVYNAILAGIAGDSVRSGGKVDICFISNNAEVTYLRSFEPPTSETEKMEIEGNSDSEEDDTFQTP